MAEITANSLVAQIAAVLGVCQGVIWAVASLAAICWHLAGNYTTPIKYYSDDYDTVLYSYFYEAFIRDRDRTPGLYVQPVIFFTLAILYFCFHLLWIITSILLYIGNRRTYKRITLETAIAWIINSIIITVNDVVAFALLTHDYQYCIDAYNDTSEFRLLYLYSIIVYGTMMTLSARGYFLWLINSIITGFMIKAWLSCRAKLIKETEQRNLYEEPGPEQAPSEGRLSQLPSPEPASTTSTFRPFRRNVYYETSNYVPDPEIERRMSKYTMTPDRRN